MSEETKKKMQKIQPVISEEAYTALLHMRVDERCTAADIVDKAILEYAQNHWPGALPNGMR